MKKLDIYTDGACSGNPGPGGYGVVIIYNEHIKEISGAFKLTTNNRMEVMAVIEGLKVLKEPCEISLFSDSKYVVDAIEKGWLVSWKSKNWTRGKKQPVLNVDLWKELDELLHIHKVKFIWVKGHANNEQNERCDFLAREAISKGVLNEDVNYSALTY